MEIRGVKVEIIDKEAIPKEENGIPEKNLLRETIRALGYDKALKFKAKSWASAKEIQSSAHQAASFLRKSGETISLKTQIEEVELTPQRQEKYDQSKNRGDFPRTVYVYVWKWKEV